MSLEEIAERLKGMGNTDQDDIEANHSDADELLEEVILHLGVMHGGQVGLLCTEIVATYRGLRKWYA